MPNLTWLLLGNANSGQNETDFLLIIFGQLKFRPNYDKVFEFEELKTNNFVTFSSINGFQWMLKDVTFYYCVQMNGMSTRIRAMGC